MKPVFITGPEMVDDARVRLIATHVARAGMLPVWLDVATFMDRSQLAFVASRYASLVASAGGQFWAILGSEQANPLGLGVYRDAFMVAMLRSATDRDVRLWTWDRWEKCLEGSL